MNFRKILEKQTDHLAYKMLSRRLIIASLVLLAVCDCKDVTVSKWKIDDVEKHKSPNGRITMTKENAKKVLAKMVNRFNGVSSPLRLAELREKPEYENKKSYIAAIKDKLATMFDNLRKNHINKHFNRKTTGKVEKQSFGKMVKEKFDRYWNKAVENFNGKIKYVVVKGSDGKFYSLPKADRSHFFMG